MNDKALTGNYETKKLDYIESPEQLVRELHLPSDRYNVKGNKIKIHKPGHTKNSSPEILVTFETDRVLTRDFTDSSNGAGDKALMGLGIDPKRLKRSNSHKSYKAQSKKKVIVKKQGEPEPKEEKRNLILRKAIDTNTKDRNKWKYAFKSELSEITELSESALKDWSDKTELYYNYEALKPYKESVYFAKYQTSDAMYMVFDKNLKSYNHNNHNIYLCPEGNTDAVALVSHGLTSNYGILKRTNKTTFPDIPDNAKTVIFIRDPDETKEELQNKVISNYSTDVRNRVKFLTVGSEYLRNYDFSEFLVIDESDQTTTEIIEDMINNSIELDVKDKIEIGNYVDELVNGQNTAKPVKYQVISNMLDTAFEWYYNEVLYDVNIKVNSDWWNSLNTNPEFKEYWENKLPMDNMELDDRVLASTENFITIILENKYSSAVSIEKHIKRHLKGLDTSKVYHPIKEYFEPLETLESLDPLYQYLGYLTLHPDYEKYRENFVKCFALWLAMTYRNAIKDEKNYTRFTNDFMIILSSSDQGAGKSKFLEHLVPDELLPYVSNMKDDSKDGLITLSKNFIFFDNELDNMNRKQIETLKDNISQPYIKARLPYGRKEETLLKRASFIGTTNKNDFLFDASGNRRFLTIPVIKNPDSKTHYKNMQGLENFDSSLLWRIAKYYHLKYKNLYVGDDMLDFAKVINEDFEQPDPYVEILRKYCLANDITDKSESNFMQPIDILEKLIPKVEWLSAIKNDRYATTNLGKALQKLGFERKSKRVNGSPRYGYYVKFKI